MDVDLEKEMKEDAIVIQYLQDKEIATDFYRALCNMRWKKKDNRSLEEQTFDKLKGENNIWSCSWRYAGGIIADIRNAHYTRGNLEDYIDYYCSGQESQVTELVKECFYRMGWTPFPWED